MVLVFTPDAAAVSAHVPAAAAEVKAAAAELAIEAASAILTRRTAGLKSDPLVDQAMADLSNKLQ